MAFRVDVPKPRILLASSLFVVLLLVADDNGATEAETEVEVVEDVDEVGAVIGLVLVTVSFRPPRVPCFMAN